MCKEKDSLSFITDTGIYTILSHLIEKVLYKPFLRSVQSVFWGDHLALSSEASIWYTAKTTIYGCNKVIRAR